VQQTCGLSLGKIKPTTIYEDNSVCIVQLKEGYIKGDRTNIFFQNSFSLMIFKEMVM